MKIIKIRVISNAKKDEVTEDGNIMRIRVKARAEGGAANKSVVVLLAEYFGVKKTAIKIVAGGKSRQKTVEVSD